MRKRRRAGNAVLLTFAALLLSHAHSGAAPPFGGVGDARNAHATPTTPAQQPAKLVQLAYLDCRARHGSAAYLLCDERAVGPH